MSSLSKAATPPRSRGSPSPDVEQSGRSTSSLHAEKAAAAAMRQHSQSSPPRERPETPVGTAPTAADHSPQGLSPNPEIRVSASDPFISRSLSGSTSELSTVEAGSVEGHSASAVGGYGATGAVSPLGSSSLEQPKYPEVYSNRLAYAPSSLRDLGSDYTRYFNPFSDSRASSQVDLSSSTRYTSSTNLLPTHSNGQKYAESASSMNPYVKGGDTEKAAFSPFLDDRLVAPLAEKGVYPFPMFADEPEPDDDLHMPRPDDDILLKPKLRDHFSRENIVSTFGLIFMILGLLFVFVAVPVLSWKGVWTVDSGHSVPIEEIEGASEVQAWAKVNDKEYALLKNIRTGLIDPTTPESAKTRTSIKGEELELVFSDEFNDNNRTFYPGDDPFFYAADLWYGATEDLEWYDPDAVTTYNGTLQLRLDSFQNHGLNYRSGMVHSWNQMCFKGGVFEVSVSLPGPGGAAGLWPGVWTMGNLGRPGYMATTDGVWPYTYDSCDWGITPNQSMTDGTSKLPGQRLPSCTCDGEEHPTPGRGRGAPEIDILEGASNYNGLGVATQSYQVAPFDIWYYPNYDFAACPHPEVALPNTYTGGPYQQAVSATSMLNDDWYDGNAYQKYAFEYVPGGDEDAFIAWFVGDQNTFFIDGRAIGPNGNVDQRYISEEPMSIIMNLGISNSWGWIDWDAMEFPAVMRIDYVRIYQRKGHTLVTCDPPGYETTGYIKNHPKAYENYNMTKWEDAGYDWPKHKLNSECTSAGSSSDK